MYPVSKISNRICFGQHIHTLGTILGMPPSREDERSHFSLKVYRAIKMIESEFEYI